jgi:hypothetical protein
MLEGFAREAYAKGNYAYPIDTSAIAYAKRALALDPFDSYSKDLLENSVTGGKYRAQQALNSKDFSTAHRVANALDKLLPGRKDIAQLQQSIHSAESAVRETPQEPAPVAGFPAYHLHSDKVPTDHGPYCLGTLGVVSGHVKFVGNMASNGEDVHTLDFACSEIKEIKKNARVAARQGGFHVRTRTGNFNFAPLDYSLSHMSDLASACWQ